MDPTTFNQTQEDAAEAQEKSNFINNNAIPTAPPQYDDVVTSYPPSTQAVLTQPPVNAYPQPTQAVLTQPPAVGETSNIVMMGDMAYEQIQTPNGPSLVRRTLGSKSSHLTCQFCKKKIETLTEPVSTKDLMGEEEWKRAKRMMICFLLIPPGCLLFPCVYCMFYNAGGTKHICPSCELPIGVYMNGTSNFFYTAGTPEAQYAEMRARLNRRRNS